MCDDDFCLIHGREFMACEKVWGAIPYCTQCDADQKQVETDQPDPRSED